MSLLQDVLRGKHSLDAKALDLEHRLSKVALQTTTSDDSDDELVNVVSLPGTPARTRPPSPTRNGAAGRPLPGPLHISSSRRDLLKALPTEISQRIFGLLPVKDLAKCALVSKKWNRSQTINYVWFKHYRKDNFQDESLPPGKWTKRESKQNWRVVHIQNGRRSPPTMSRGSRSGYTSPIGAGAQTPRELKEEQWRQEAEISAPGKVEMRGMYKELNGRKSKAKPKWGAVGGGGIRDKGASRHLEAQQHRDRHQNLHQNRPPRLRLPPSNGTTSKKRKWKNQNTAKPPTATKPTAIDVDGVEDDEDDPDSRELTAEEIWDDSALIDAWNAATEEYEILNGPDKAWKNEPVHKSPLWYNVPTSKPPKKKARVAEQEQEQEQGEEGDSQPLDFETFVPTYDASLALPAADDPSAPASGYALPTPGPGMPGQDEAFQRALGAMYWGGYWTAVYHCQRSAAAQKEATEDAEEESAEEEENDDEDEAFLSTQR
ncbi:Dolichol-phosphate mannosyltransferase subunit 1 [Mycena kentingensis (nom. inval.)]|nr:Dolichol-phosphate mannosyltransferase subunit 1 [Mycena kentingensis (nom. inval.)]